MSILKTEIDTDPLGRGYSGMTNLEIANDLNVVYCTKNKTSMTGSEILNNIVISEWTPLTDAQKRTVWDVVHLSDINPFGVEAQLLIAVFGAGSDTIAALADARKYDVSRAEELGIPYVYEGHVIDAKLET